MKRKILFILVLIFGFIQLKAQDNVVAFEEPSVSRDYRSTLPSFLERETKKIKGGKSALKWTNIKNYDILTLDVTKAKMVSQWNNSLLINIYSEKKTEDSLIVKLYNDKNVVVRTGRMLLNFTGWRAYHRSITYDYGINGTNESNNLRDRDGQNDNPRIIKIEIQFKSPIGNISTLYFDEIILEKSSTPVIPGLHNLPDYKQFKKEAYTGALTSYLYHQDTIGRNLDSDRTFTIKAIKDDNYQGGGALGPAITEQNKILDAESKVDYLLSVPVIIDPSRFEDLVNLAHYSGIIARKINNSGGNPDLKNKLNRYIAHLLEQGLAEGGRGIIPYNKYSQCKNFAVGFLLAYEHLNDELKPELIKMLKWSNEYNRIFANEITEADADYFLNKSVFLPKLAMLESTDSKKVKALRYYSNFIGKYVAPKSGNIGLVKPDGVSFHHGAQHIRYMITYSAIIDRAHELIGTDFKISKETYDKIIFAFKALVIQSSKAKLHSNASSGRSPFPSTFILGDSEKDKIKQLIAVGRDVLNVSREPDLESFYEYIIDESNTKFDGFYQLNYTQTGIFRKNKWMASMKGFTNFLWGSEIYATANRYGRYQSYGALEILYGGSLASSGYISGGRGWDWNMMPGTTTVRKNDYNDLNPLPGDFGTEFQSKPFSGALSLGQNGIFAMDFEQNAKMYDGREGNPKYSSDRLKFRKTVFAFDDYLIALGSDISATSGKSNTVITTLFQSVKESATPDVFINSLSKETTDYGEKTLSGTKFNWLVNSEGTGFYLPSGQDEIMTYRGSQESPDHSGNQVLKYSAKAAKVWINHKNDPKNAGYEFVVIPAATPSVMLNRASEFAEGKKYKVLIKDSKAHVVVGLKEKLIAYAIFEPFTKPVGADLGYFKSINAPVLLGIKANNDRTINVSIANPDLNYKLVNTRNLFDALESTVSLILDGRWEVENSRGSGKFVLQLQGNETTITYTLKDGLKLDLDLKKNRIIPTLTWSDPTDIVYGTPLSDVQLNASADVAGTFNYEKIVGTVLNVGRSQSLKVDFLPSDTLNYTKISKVVNIAVFKAVPSITWPNPVDIIYGTALSSTELNASSTSSGSFTYTPAFGTILNAGSKQQLKVNFIPTDTLNYFVVAKTVNINVNKVTPIISWSKPIDLVYGTVMSEVKLNNNADVAGIFVYTPALATQLNAGANQSFRVDFIPADTANYSAVSKTVTINVAKATPMVAWNSPADITYGKGLSSAELNAVADVAGTLTFTPSLGTVLNAGKNQLLKVEFIPADTMNYLASSRRVSINVAKAVPKVAWNSPADITYGKGLSFAELNAVVDVAGTLTYTPSLGTVFNAGNKQLLKVDFIPDDTANYSASSKRVSINVAKATPMVAWNNPADITYGKGLSAAELNAVAEAAGTFIYKPAPGTILDAGNSQLLKVDFIPADTANYLGSSKIVSINVAKATPKVAWNSPADITYGKGLSSAELKAVADVAGTLTYTPVHGTMLNAGNSQSLKVDFVPSDTANYSPVSKTVIISVAKATPKVAWNSPAGISYGKELSSSELNAIADVAGTLTYTPSLGTVINAGNNQLLKGDFMPADTVNYSAVSKSVIINVAKATPKVVWNSPAGISYGKELSSAELNAVADVAGTLTYIPSLGTVFNAGKNQLLRADFMPADTVNYSAVSKSVIINVAKATPKIAWNSPADITYGKGLSAAELNAVAEVVGTFIYKPAFGTMLNASNNQSLKVDFVPADTANYSAVSKTRIINVAKATPMVAWNSSSGITYGKGLSAAELNAVAEVAGTFTYAPALGTMLNAGNDQSLKVEFAPADTANYSAVSKTVSINVSKRNISASLTLANKIYDGTIVAAISAKDLLGVLDIDQTDVSLLNGSAEFASPDIGNGKTVTASGLSLTGKRSNNYLLNGVISSVANITAKEIFITAEVKSKIYGENDPTLTYVLPTGSLVSKDIMTGVLNRSPGENVGSYSINQSTLSAGSNYKIIFKPAQLQIAPKDLVITIEDKSRDFMALDPVFTARYSGFIGTENMNLLTDPVIFSTTASVNSFSGPYPINGRGAVATNYSISYKPGILTILPKRQDIIFNELPTKISTDVPFTLDGRTSSGLDITYTSSDANVARVINKNQIEIRSAGNVNITANQTGNVNYLPAIEVTRKLIILDNPAPVVNITSNKGNSITKGETAILTANGAFRYYWTNANGIVKGQSSAELTVRPSENTTYSVTGFDQYGRSDTKSFSIGVKSDFDMLNVKNVLTPNGDGKNDTWIVENIDMYPNNIVRILDRSGKKVFEMARYDNSWDGTFKGNILPEDSYYYIIDFGSGNRIIRGFITIVGRK
nr:MBG domain-containing protein [Pedobacter sp. ASV2]